MSESENDEDILRRGKRLKIDNKKNTQLLDFNDSEYNNFIIKVKLYNKNINITKI